MAIKQQVVAADTGQNKRRNNETNSFVVHLCVATPTYEAACPSRRIPSHSFYIVLD